MGEGKGNDCCCACGSESTDPVACPRTEDIDGLALEESRGVLAALFRFESEGESLAGNGNNGLLSFLRRGRRKKVVVVDIICVVVVCA